MLTARMSFLIRPATSEDIPQLQELIELSIRQLSTECYSPTQIEGSLGFLFGPDTQLIVDATYFVATPADNRQLIVGCGGTSICNALWFESPAHSVVQPWPDIVAWRNASGHSKWVTYNPSDMRLEHKHRLELPHDIIWFRPHSWSSACPTRPFQGGRQYQSNLCKAWLHSSRAWQADHRAL